MAQVFVSPGAYTKEIDESFVPAGAGAIGAALVGLTKKGPAYLPVEVGNFGEYREIFGGLDPDLYTPYAAKSYLKNAGTLNVVRVLGRATASIGTAVMLAFPIANTTATAALSASNMVGGILRLRGDVEEVQLSGTPTNFAISIVGKGVTATNLSLTESSSNYVKKVLGTSPRETRNGDSLTALYVDAVFDHAVGSILGTVSADAAGNLTANGGFVTCTADSTQVTGGFAPGRTPAIISQNFNGTVHDLFRVYTRSDGDAANTDIKISITQVDTSTTSAPAFTLLVRSANDTDDLPNVLETFQNLVMDRASKQFIGRVIGDRYPSYSLGTTPPEILFDGEYQNRSNYIRVEVYDGFPDSARPSGYRGFTKIVPPLANVPEPPVIANQLNSISDTDPNIFLGINFGAGSGGVYDTLKTSVTYASGSTSGQTGQIYFAVSGDLSGSGSIAAGLTNIDMIGSNSGNFTSNNKIRYTVPMFRGFDGLDPRSDKRVDINDGTLSADYNIAIKTLGNSDEIDFNLIAAPGAHSTSTGGNIPQMMLDMIESRGDAFGIVDLSNGTATANALALTVSNAITEAKKYDTNYGATYFPWIRINDADNDRLLWVPPSVEVMGAYAFNDRVGQAWFAPAGFTRGGLESVLEARRRLTQTQRDDLYNANVNPIATFPGMGVAIWGQKTLQKKASLLDRVNVRRMLIEVRKTIAGFSRSFVFEPNSVTMRANLLSRVNSYLGTVQAAQGLQEFRAVLDGTTTTPDLIDRNIVKGKIFLKPTTAAEIIILDFSVTRTGAVFSE